MRYTDKIRRLGRNITNRGSVASTIGTHIGVDNPVDSTENARQCLPPGFYGVPDSGDEVVLNDDPQDPIVYGVVNDLAEVEPGVAMIKKGAVKVRINSNTDEVEITNAASAKITLKANGDIEIDGSNVVVNGGASGIARVGDSVSVSTVTGIGTITSGSSNFKN